MVITKTDIGIGAVASCMITLLCQMSCDGLLIAKIDTT